MAIQNKCILVCLVYHAFFIVQASSNGVISKHFYRPGTSAILGDKFRSEKHARSGADCVSRCPSCPAVSFSDVSGECRLYSEQNNSVVPMTSGPSVWINEQFSLLAVENADKSMMTFTQATTICQSLHGHLATTTDLLKAKDNGYHSCRCGWLSDNTVRFTLTYSGSGCPYNSTGTTGPGMFPCKFDLITLAYTGIYPTKAPTAYCTF